MLIFLASDDILECGDCHGMTVPKSLAVPPPLLGGALSLSPPNIDRGLLTRPNLFPRLCDFVLFGARAHWI